MKSKLNKKLELNKRSISNLDHEKMGMVGGNTVPIPTTSWGITCNGCRINQVPPESNLQECQVTDNITPATGLANSCMDCKID